MKKIISLLLALCMLLSVVTVASAETIYENIPFDGQGNSKTFVGSNKTDYDYINFVDYMGISSGTVKIKESDIEKYKPLAVLVAPDGILQDTGLAFNDDGFWVVEGIPNKVNVNEKAIKVQAVDPSETSLTDVQKAQVETTSMHTISITPAKYSRIYAFATTLWSNHKVKVTITYADNTKEEKTITVIQKPFPDFKTYAGESIQDRNDKGYTVARPSTTTGSTEGQSGIYFYPYCITTNPEKEIIRIGFTATSRVGVTIISLTGVQPDAEDIVKYAKSVETIDETSYEVNKFFPQQAKALVEAEGKDVTALDELASKIKAYEVENNIVTETVEPEAEPEIQVPVVKGEMNFTDLDSVSWAKDAIKYLYDNDIASGTSDTTFSPNEHLTREQFVKIICGAFNVPSSSQAVSFKDVKKGAWYESFVKDACGAGLVSGTSKDTFGVGQKITRQDLAVIIYRAVGDKIKAEGKAPVFNDKAEIDGYAVAAVTVLSKAGIINGSNGNFNPKNYCTRAEMAKIVYGVISNIGEEATK